MYTYKASGTTKNARSGLSNEAIAKAGEKSYSYIVAPKMVSPGSKPAKQ